ncbi:MAG: hypothetical protein NZX77_21530 [Polyangiaceae bacterium]|nr:hypothetical protein [Polyangiaceae bacterium]
MVTSPQLKIQWTTNLATQPLAPPLLDLDRNVYLCTQAEIISLDKNGKSRWTYSFLPSSPSACSMALSAEGQLDVITNTRVFRFNK